MKGTLIAVFSALVLIAAIVAGRFLLTRDVPDATPVTGAYKNIQGGEMRYANTDLNFSFSVPEGLVAEEGFYGSKDVRYARLVDASGSVALMIIITPTSGTDNYYTRADAARDIPGTVIENPRETGILLETYGVLFSSQNPLWTKPSIEYWFQRGGYHYRVATPGDMELMNFVGASWSWNG